MLKLKKERLFMLRENLSSKSSEYTKKANIKLLMSNDDLLIQKYFEYCTMVDSFDLALFRINHFIDLKLSNNFITIILTNLDQLHLLEIRDEFSERYSYYYDCYDKMVGSPPSYYDNEEKGKITGKYLAYQKILLIFDSLLPIKMEEIVEGKCLHE